MQVSELQRLAEHYKNKTVRIYNPDTEDFTVNYEQKPYTINALEMQEFPYFIAQHIKKHLADKLLHKRGTKINPQDDLENIKREIEVEL